MAFGIPTGLVKGFVDETLLIGREKASAAAKAQEKAEEQTKENIRNIRAIYTPDLLSKSKAPPRNQIQQLVALGIPTKMAVSMVDAGHIQRRHRLEDESTKTFAKSIDSMKEGKTPLPNMANLLLVAETSKDPNERQSAIRLLRNISNFNWNGIGHKDYSSFAKYYGTKFEEKRRSDKIQQNANQDVRDLYAHFKVNPPLGEHFTYPTKMFEVAVMGTAAIEKNVSPTELNMAHNLFLEKTNDHLRSLDPELRKDALENQYLKSLAAKSVETLINTPIETNVGGVPYEQRHTREAILKDKLFIKELLDNNTSSPKEKSQSLRKTALKIEKPLNPDQKRFLATHYKPLSEAFEKHPDTRQLAFLMTTNSVARSLSLDPSTVTDDNASVTSLYTKKLLGDERQLKLAYNKWYANPTPENSKIYMDAMDKITQGYSDNTADNLAHGIVATALHTLHNIDPLQSIVTVDGTATPKETKFKPYRLINLPKNHANHSLVDEFTKAESTMTSLMGDIDDILVFYGSGQNRIKIGNSYRNLSPPIRNSKMLGFEAQYQVELQNWGKKIAGMYRAIKNIVTSERDTHFENGRATNPQLSAQNQSRLSWADKRMKQIEDNLKTTDDAEYRKRSIVEFRKLALTYRLSGMVQGNATGGRTISNQDFEVMFKALWGSEEASKSRLLALRDKLASMRAFATVNNILLTHGAYEMLSDQKAHGKMNSLRNELVKRFNARFDAIDQEYMDKDQEALKQGAPDAPVVETPSNAQAYIDKFTPHFRTIYKNIETDEWKDFLTKRSNFIKNLYTTLTPDFLNKTETEQAKISEHHATLLYAAKVAAQKVLDKKDVITLFGGERIIGEGADAKKELVLGEDVTLQYNLLNKLRRTQK